MQPPDGVPSASDLPPGVSAAAVKDAGSLANALEKVPAKTYNLTSKYMSKKLRN